METDIERKAIWDKETALESAVDGHCSPPKQTLDLFGIWFWFWICTTSTPIKIDIHHSLFSLYPRISLCPHLYLEERIKKSPMPKRKSPAVSLSPLSSLFPLVRLPPIVDSNTPAINIFWRKNTISVQLNGQWGSEVLGPKLGQSMIKYHRRWR